LIKPAELFFGHQIHAPGGARPADLQMMKSDSGLNHGLQEKLFIGRYRTHPTLFPRVVGRMVLAGVVEVDPGNVLDWITDDVFLSVRWRIYLHRAIVADE